ncbi:MAG: hypothetical protein HY431_02835 [Candidatus Levybacteria bacterium]|nr:hypothetical protein [Candidatus Levybacteria bacterium]
MKAERLILSFIALLIGLGVAGVAFYFYQSTKVIPQKETNTTQTLKATPTPDTSGYILAVDSPKDEEVVNNKTITIAGKTVKDATIIVTTETDEQIITPAQNGNFSTTQTISNGANIIQITAIFPDGGEKKVIRTVSFSTESF